MLVKSILFYQLNCILSIQLIASPYQSLSVFCDAYTCFRLLVDTAVLTMCEILSIYSPRKVHGHSIILQIQKFWALLFALLMFFTRYITELLYLSTVSMYTPHVYFLIRRVFYWNNHSFCLWHMHVRHTSLFPFLVKMKFTFRNMLLNNFPRFNSLSPKTGFYW